MKAFLLLGAFVSGLALVIAAAYLGGYLAAIAIPKAYFAFFGSAHKRWALAIMDALAMALPFFLLSLAWCWLTLRRAGASLKVAAWCCLAGIVAGLTYTQVQSAITLRALEGAPNSASFLGYLWRVFPPLAVLDLLAFPVGFLAAVALLHRHLRTSLVGTRQYPRSTDPDAAQ
jgi:hypothetical protein